MGSMVYSLLWVMHDLDPQPYVEELQGSGSRVQGFGVMALGLSALGVPAFGV